MAKTQDISAYVIIHTLPHLGLVNKLTNPLRLYCYPRRNCETLLCLIRPFLIRPFSGLVAAL